MYRFPSAAREQKKKDCEHLGRLPAIIGNTARGASQAKPVNTATATVDEEHGYFLIGHVCNERRQLTSDPSPPSHEENREILPKATLDDAEHESIVEPSIARPQRNGNCGTPQFSARPNQGTCRCTTTGA